MNLRSMKARVPIAALGVTALIAGAGALTSPALAAGVTLAFGPTDTSATIVNVVPGTNTGNSGLTYGVKVTGASGSDPMYVGIITAPTGGSLYTERVPTNGVPTADATATALVNATPLAVVGTGTALSSTLTFSTAGAVGNQYPTVADLAGHLIRIGTSPYRYAKVTTGGTNATSVTLDSPLVSSVSGAALADLGLASANNVFAGGVVSTSVPIAGYAAGDNVYFGAVVPGDYTFRLFQDHNGNTVYEAGQDDATATFTLHVKDVTGNTASDTSDDLNFGLTTPASVDLGQTIDASATLSGLSTVDTRGVNGSSLGRLGVNLAAATNYNGTYTTTTGTGDGLATFDGTAFTKSFATATAAGSFDLQTEFDVNGSGTFTGADYIPTSQKRTTTVGT